jgi:hypothetical protein
MRRIPIFGVLVILGLGYWGWDATHHDDHPGTHASPVPVTAVEKDVLGQWRLEEGEGDRAAIVKSARCKPGEKGDEEGPDVHFRCDLVLDDGTRTTRVIHLLTAIGGYQLLMNEVS